jgi:predicted transcriptional regulator
LKRQWKTDTMTELSKTTFKMPTDLKNQVKSLAKKENTTMSALILEMLVEGYEKRRLK